jgi:DNA polymerase elongation subunit (family B)
MQHNSKTVLALYPNRYGVAYALFHTAKELLEYGIGNIQPVSNKKVLQRIKKYIEHYKPDVIITRNINDLGNRKNKRIQALIDALCDEARCQNLEIYSYTRSEIKEVFLSFDAESKYVISKKIIEWFPELKSYEYPPRKKWMAENYNSGLFDAMSLAVTHFWNSDS